MTNFLCCEMWCFNRQIFLRRLSCNENLLQTQLTLTSLCSVHRNPPRFQTSTPMRKHGPTTCLAWTPAGVLTPQLLPCSHGRKAAIVRPTLAQKVSRWFFKFFYYAEHFYTSVCDLFIKMLMCRIINTVHRCRLNRSSVVLAVVMSWGSCDHSAS